MFTLDETVCNVCELGVKKVQKPLLARLLLGFVGGAYVAFGYMTYILIVAQMPGIMGKLLGACVFPIGLVMILFAGGELITGNMMVVATSFFNKKIKLKSVLKNWFVITCGNILGAAFIALVFGVYVGTLMPYSETVKELAIAKIHYTPMQTLVSGIACNWFVGIAVWLSQSLKDGTSKLIGVWFPVMVFVLLGYQHSVANVFLLTLGNYFGAISFVEFGTNFAFSYIGNIIGGAIFVGLLYTLSNKHD